MTGVVAVWAEVAAALAKVLGPSSTGRRPVRQTGGSEEVAFRYSMACPMTQLASHSLQETFLHAPQVQDSDLAVEA